MRKDPTEFRKRFAAWKDGKQPYEAGLPKYEDGSFNDDVYKNMYWQGNDDSTEYLRLVEDGTPEKIALDYIKRSEKTYPEQYYIKGPTLPEVIIKPNPNSMSTAMLTTYYPWSTAFPITGHSTLELIHKDGDYSGFVTSYGDDPWYNFVTDNCSDATRKAIELATGKKINPAFFTTPGDVKDFVESDLGGRSTYDRRGFSETIFNIPTKLARKIVEYSKTLDKKRFAALKNGDLPKYGDGKSENNWFDDLREKYPTTSTIASFLPVVGTGMDIYDAYKNPTPENVGFAALSAATDLIGGRIFYKIAGNSLKAKKAFKAAKKAEYDKWKDTPFIQNMSKSEAKKTLKYYSERAGEKAQTLIIDDPTFRIPNLEIAAGLGAYVPDFIANMNQLGIK